MDSHSAAGGQALNVNINPLNLRHDSLIIPLNKHPGRYYNRCRLQPVYADASLHCRAKVRLILSHFRMSFALYSPPMPAHVTVEQIRRHLLSYALLS